MDGLLSLRFIHSRPFMVFFAFCLFFVCFGSRLSFADDVDQVCNTDSHKIWYVAIGSDVFAFPYDQFFNSTGGPLVEDVDPRQALLPPNPKAPIGCKDNPQQLRHFSVLNRPEIESINPTASFPQYIGLLEMSLYPGPYAPAPIGYPIIEDQLAARITCQTKKFIVSWNDGTILCTNTRKTLNPILNPSNDYVSKSWEFIISGNKYLTPLGQNLVENEFLNSVDVSYLLTPNIYLHYSWLPPKSASAIDPIYLITLDQLFLQKLSSYRVLNYQWPSHSPESHT